MLTIMEENQKILESVEKVNENESVAINEAMIDNGSGSVITSVKADRKQKDLTFVSSPLFAEMILASFNERSISDSTILVTSHETFPIDLSDATNSDEALTSVISESVIPVVKMRSSIPTKIRNLSDPSVSTGTTLEKKSSQYNLEVALLRREGDYRYAYSNI